MWGVNQLRCGEGIGRGHELHILINNAGVLNMGGVKYGKCEKLVRTHKGVGRGRNLHEETEDAFEAHMGCNHPAALPIHLPPASPPSPLPALPPLQWHARRPRMPLRRTWAATTWATSCSPWRCCRR